jgi:hypothetical protein
MPGDPKPEQTLCRLRRRDIEPASRSSSFRRSAGSGEPATVQASLARSRAVPGDPKPEQTLCRLRRRDGQNPGSIGTPQLWQRGRVGGRGVGM